MDSQDGTRCPGLERLAVVGDPRPVRRTHLDQAQPGAPDDVGDAHAAADLDQLAASDCDALGRRPPAADQPAAAPPTAAASASATAAALLLVTSASSAPVRAMRCDLRRAEARRHAGRCSRSISRSDVPCAAAVGCPDGCLRPRRPPEVGVQDDAGRVHDRHEAGATMPSRSSTSVIREGIDGCRPVARREAASLLATTSRAAVTDRAWSRSPRRGRAAASTPLDARWMRRRLGGHAVDVTPAGRSPRPRRHAAPGASGKSVASPFASTWKSVSRCDAGPAAGRTQRPIAHARLRGWVTASAPISASCAARETRGSGHRARPHRRAPSCGRRCRRSRCRSASGLPMVEPDPRSARRLHPARIGHQSGAGWHRCLRRVRGRLSKTAKYSSARASISRPPALADGRSLDAADLGQQSAVIVAEAVRGCRSSPRCRSSGRSPVPAGRLRASRASASTVACSCRFSTASRTAEVTARRSSGSASVAGSWTSAIIGRPRRSMRVTARPVPAAGIDGGSAVGAEVAAQRLRPLDGLEVGSRSSDRRRPCRVSPGRRRDRARAPADRPPPGCPGHEAGRRRSRPARCRTSWPRPGAAYARDRGPPRLRRRV